MITSNGIKEFNLKRVEIDSSVKYPQWTSFCSDPKSEHEICFVHPKVYKTKPKEWFELNMRGAYAVNYYGSKIAPDRCKFENSLRFCEGAKDMTMCYLKLKHVEAANNLIEAYRHIK